jgi:hypothetical protein
MHLRSRLNKALALDREENRMIYETGHPLWGRSVYDGLTISIRYGVGNKIWVYIQKLDQIVYEVESLEEAEGETDGALESDGRDNGEASREEEEPARLVEALVEAPKGGRRA